MPRHPPLSLPSALALAALALGACAASTGGNGSASDGGNAGSADAGPALAKAPAPGAANAPDGSGSTTFAVSKLFMGLTDRDGTPNTENGWKRFGYDVDGKASDAMSTDVCNGRNNVPNNVYKPDGEAGIDNSFGHQILPIFAGLASDVEVKVNNTIQQGKWTLLLDMQALGSGTDYSPLVTRAYDGADAMAAPTFDTTFSWPVRPESLTNTTDVATAKTVFAQSYLVGNTWVSRPVDALRLPVSFGGFSMTLQIHNALITMELDANHTRGRKGTISGVLWTDELTAEFRGLAGAFDSSLCSGPTIDSIVTQLEQASDIMTDGTQDPTRSCNGISIGLGFEAEQVRLGVVGAATPPVMDPCE